MNATASHSDDLTRDLSLVLAGTQPVTRTDVQALIADKPVIIEQAIRRAAELLNTSTAPAVAGVRHLSIEAVREAIALAERMRGRILVNNHQPLPAPVTQTATLGHVYSCDMVIWVGCRPTDTPLTDAISHRIDLAAHAPADVSVVTALRAAMSDANSDDPIAVTLRRVKRAAAVLGPSCDARVVSQWHKFAGAMQQQVRLCVFEMPAADAANLRGAQQAITWQTGIAGNVDFADGSPRICGVNQPIDVNIDVNNCGLKAKHRIAIGPTRDPQAAVSFITPGLATGLAARVMRCDGVILWLCDNPATAPADPTIALLQQLAQQIEVPA